MRIMWVVLVVLLGTTGCTNEQLRRSTVHQAMTLNEIQHRQVMQNLATFAANRHAIPRQVTLKDGTAQITDSGSILGQVISDSFLNLGASRAVTDMWSMEPVTNDVALRLLRVAYRRALGSGEDLYTENLANTLAHELKQQTYQVDDLRTTNENTSPPPRPEGAAAQKPNVVGKGRGFAAVDGSPERPIAGGGDQEDFGYTESEIWSDRANFRSTISTNAVYMILPGEILRPEYLAFPLIPNSSPPQYKTATPLAIELRRQVYEVSQELEEIHAGWLGHSRNKHDVPKNACYVAYAKECGRGCYVWVRPEKMEDFEDFTITILGLSSLIKEPNITGTTGVKFTPNGGAATMTR